MVIPWDQDINFASALLLHSCITVLLKEFFNVCVILHRRSSRAWARRVRKKSIDNYSFTVVLDAYTSIFSKDPDGEQAELYFTNTGIILLAVSLASSIAMNVCLSNDTLNILVASTFGLSFVASLVTGNANSLLSIIMNLRRASRFIWSDTPFVNFFSLIYVATVLHGQSTLRLRDYITFRGIAIVESIFMKAKLASSSPEDQEKLLQRLLESELMPWESTKQRSIQLSNPPFVNRDDIIAFQTLQRLSVMLFKTSIGYVNGCLQGSKGPCRCDLPAKGCWVKQPGTCLQIYRSSKKTIVLADCFNQENPKLRWQQCLKYFHGILLRSIGRVRVVYAILDCEDDDEIDEQSKTLRFHSNINLVTGVPKAWLAAFEEGEPVGECVIAFRGG